MVSNEEPGLEAPVEIPPGEPLADPTLAPVAAADTEREAAQSRSGEASRGRLELLVAFLFYLVVVAAWAMPRGILAGKRVLGHPASDAAKHYWNLWWFRQMALVDHRLPFQTDYLNFPAGFKLYPIEPLNGIAALFLSPLGLVWTTNLLALFNLALAGLGMFALVRTLTGRFLPSIGAGLTYAMSSYALWTVYVGVGELSHLAWMPLALMFLVRLARDGGLKNLLATAFFCFVTAFACWYYALFLYLLAGVWMVTDPWRGRRTLQHLGRYAAALGLSLACILPIVRVFNDSYPAGPRSTEPLGEFIQRRIDSQPHDNPFTRLDPVRLVTGGRTGLEEALRNPYQGGKFVGVSILILALIGGLWRPRQAWRWGVMTGAALVLGLGSRLVLAGHEQGGLLPFAWFNLVLDRYSQAMNFPARFVMPVTLGLAVLAGLGLAVIQERLLKALERRGIPVTGRNARWMVGGLMVALGCVPMIEARARGDVVLPLPTFPVEPLPAGPFLASSPEPYGVLEIPQMFSTDSRTKSDEVLFMQIAHGKKSASMPLDRISNFVRSARTELEGLPLIVTLKTLAGYPEDGAVRSCCVQEASNDPLLVQQRGELETRGFKRLIVTYRDLTPTSATRLKAFCRKAFGPPLMEDERQEVFAIGRTLQPLP